MKKRYPLRISRGVMTESHNLYLIAERGGHRGIGESAAGGGEEAPAASERELAPFVAELPEGCAPLEAWSRARDAGISPPSLAALDIALWDLHATELGAPLHRVLGLSSRMPPTSVTIGINPPEIVRERVPEILARTGARALKVKLGSPEGTEADRSMFLAVAETVRGTGVRLRVDANGGWSLAGAREMTEWLSGFGVEFVEQPLAKGEEANLPQLFLGRPLPIFADESCHFSADVPELADRVDGIVVKLMKCGGISEALRLVAVARAHGLKTMIGCMGESSVAISAGAALGSLFDYIDLDSHLNLDPDPARGVTLSEGTLALPEKPGHGAEV